MCTVGPIYHGPPRNRAERLKKGQYIKREKEKKKEEELNYCLLLVAAEHDTHLATGEVAAARRLQRPLQVGKPTAYIPRTREIAYDMIRKRGGDRKNELTKSIFMYFLLRLFAIRLRTPRQDAA